MNLNEDTLCHKCNKVHETIVSDDPVDESGIRKEFYHRRLCGGEPSGYLKFVRTRSLYEICKDLSDVLERDLPDEWKYVDYFSVSTTIRDRIAIWNAKEKWETLTDLQKRLVLAMDEYLWPEGVRFIQVYAVTGGSEGHYVHIDALCVADYGNTREHFGLFLLKTFGGMEQALRIANRLTVALDA